MKHGHMISLYLKPHPPDPAHRGQFADMLLKTFTSEAVFLLTTFANMARARCHDDNDGDENERLFISTVALEIFEVCVCVCVYIRMCV